MGKKGRRKGKRSECIELVKPKKHFVAVGASHLLSGIVQYTSEHNSLGRNLKNEPTYSSFQNLKIIRQSVSQ